MSGGYFPAGELKRKKTPRFFFYFFYFFHCRPNEKMAEVLVGPQPRSLISSRNPYQIFDFRKDSSLNCCQALSALGNHEQICGSGSGCWLSGLWLRLLACNPAGLHATLRSSNQIRKFLGILGCCQALYALSKH